MSTQNINYTNLDSRYSKPTDVAAAISAQATTDAGQYVATSAGAATNLLPTTPLVKTLNVYNTNQTGFRTDYAVLTIGSSTIPDTSVVSTDLGRPVIGTQIPSASYVGTVVAGTSFTLVNSSGAAVNVISASGNNANFITLGPLFAPVLPALSGLTVGTQLQVQKAELDTTSTPVIITASGSDAYDSGVTSIQLKTSGETRSLQVISISGTKYWKVISGSVPTTSQDNRYAPKPIKNNLVAFVGDSITGLNGTGDNVATYHQSIDNFTHFITWLSMGRLRYGGAFQTSGYTASQIRDIVLPRMFAKTGAEQPGTVILLAGTNDVGQGVSRTVTMQAFSDIYNLLYQKGINLVCATIPPRADSTAANVLVGSLNMAIQDFAQSNGLDCLPFHTALVNPPDGKYLPNYSIADGIHPSRLGMMAMAQAVINSGWLNRFPMRVAVTAKSAADSTNLLGVYGHFLTDSNSDGVADGWSFGGSTTWTPSIVAPQTSDNLAGNWQQIVVSSTASGSGRYFQYNASITLSSSSDLLELTGRIRLSGGTAGLSTSNILGIGLSPTGGSGVSDQTAQGTSVDISDGTFTIRQRVTSSYTNFRITLTVPNAPTTGSITISLGEVTVRNLTALGLA